MSELLETDDLKNNNDGFRRITKAEYVKELEDRVKEYMKIITPFPVNTTKYHRINVPSFSSDEEYKEFWFEQFRRCRDGYQDMCGKQYFYYNFCAIESLKHGKIFPDYRVVDNEWFKLVTECQQSHEWGIVCVKRRRVGASWKEAADVIHDCLFNKNFHVGMNSKSEKDSILLFRKVKFIYNHLPPEMRVKTTSSSKMFMDFSYVDPVDGIKKGQESDIIVVPPTDSAFEGMALNKWVCDEAGKINNLLALFSFTEDCLMQETVRVGVPIIFGTSGDVGKEGSGLKHLWDFAHIYKLRKFFFGGWMGLYVDEYGNDNIEEAVRWIVYERRRREGMSTKMYNDFVQKYPLTAEEALMDHTITGLGDPVKIQAQRSSLILNPPTYTRGQFREADGKVLWYPDNFGPIIVYQHPIPGAKFVAGCDPADIDDATGNPSDLATYVMSLPDGASKPAIVMEYVDRPRELNTYYYQLALALQYYNGCKLLVERQKGGRLISFLKDLGLYHLFMTNPQEIRRLYPGRTVSIGVHLDPVTKDYMRGLVTEYVDLNHELIPSISLLDELLAFGSRNTDRAIAFGLTLMALRELSKTYLLKKQPQYMPWIPGFKYVKDSRGNIRLERRQFTGKLITHK